MSEQDNRFLDIQYFHELEEKYMKDCRDLEALSLLSWGMTERRCGMDQFENIIDPTENRETEDDSKDLST